MDEQGVRLGRRHFFRVVAAAAAMIPLAAANPAHARRPDRPKKTKCLLPGTAILTDRGPVAVERLHIGDRVLTESGAFKPIRGIGRNMFAKQSGDRWDENVAPVRIARSAISAGVPARELYVSPEHALYIDGYLIAVKCLINGLSITQDVTARDVFEYIHLEFERHEVFYAEGAAVESLQVFDAHQATGEFAQYERDGSPAGAMAPYAPRLGYFGGRQEAIALARLAVYPWIDVRDRIQVVHDRLAVRANLLHAVSAETALAS